MNATMGTAVGLDAAVVGAAVDRLRLSLTRRIRLLLMLLLRRLLTLLLRRLLMLLLRRLLMLLLRRLLTLLLRWFSLLMLLPRLRFVLLLTLLLLLCVSKGMGSEKQEQYGCADNANSFHLSVLLTSARLLLTLGPSSLC
ncbi:MAG: hypothetical protein LAN64_11085 [Acidobacteriia bacterium]|nr:hypothetical protein [Terriglobia bacterium]